MVRLRVQQRDFGFANAAADIANRIPTTKCRAKVIHHPVLLNETIQYLEPADNGIYVDGTLGLGGHTTKILEKCGPGGKVIGFEWDATALKLAQKKLSPYGERIQVIRRNFAQIKETLAELGLSQIDGLLLDLGFSSLQLDASGRGFSFKGREPLDMRMDDRRTLTAAELVNEAGGQELADIFYHYGGERCSRRIAANIVEARGKARIETTDILAEIVSKSIPRRFHPKKIHVATKVFQALRIAVNHELENLDKILDDAPSILKPGAKFCVISFHSLEDRLVKWKFRNNQVYKVLTKKPVVPGLEERRVNPRSRSAKLRVAAIKYEAAE